MPSRLHTFGLRALKGGLELVLAAYGWRSGKNPRRAGIGGNPALTAEKS